ncbi:ParB/RepB/Spo0J family partition protein [Streptomyces sp. NPDC018019]|uniref:ParB/RepB/Spo0J family partition protein n=1 Tax=Streptomyces sp. NPDC018019 TaxID=3365030 RepID=UPI003799048B
MIDCRGKRMPYSGENHAPDFAGLAEGAKNVTTASHGVGLPPTEYVEIRSLVCGNSPRLGGPNPRHVNFLAEFEGTLPPILVHRDTLQVIDGEHRVLAARQRGDEKILVHFFDGSEGDAFVRGVRANITHGLPLTLADRSAAAHRLLSLFPDWSDRAVARTAGISATTVGAIRRRTTDETDQLNTRLGRDGKMRPLNAADGRRRAAELIRGNPHASLREVAREAGISVATVRDVRQRLSQGRSPVPDKQLRNESRQHTTVPGSPDAGPARSGKRPPTVILERLRRDPSLRSRGIGRSLITWLGAQISGADKCSNVVDWIPAHCAALVIEAAHGLSQQWSNFAEALECRSGTDQ